MVPSRHDRKLVDVDDKPQHKQNIAAIMANENANQSSISDKNQFKHSFLLQHVTGSQENDVSNRCHPCSAIIKSVLSCCLYAIFFHRVNNIGPCPSGLGEIDGLHGISTHSCART